MTASLRRATPFVVSLALAAVAFPAFAHHGWSDYDADKALTLKGRVKAASYENPHATITLDADGKTWTVVLAPVSRMESRGASRDAVAVGREVTIVGYPSKTHAGEVRAERVMFRDGAADKTVELR